jgi:hypothetical protein
MDSNLSYGEDVCIREKVVELLLAYSFFHLWCGKGIVVPLHAIQAYGKLEV